MSLASISFATRPSRPSTERSGSSLFAVVLRRDGRLRPGQRRCSRARPSSAPRSSWQPTASRTSTTRTSRAPSSTGRSRRACSRSSCWPIGLPLYWIMEPGRQENAASGFGRTLRPPGRGPVRRHRRERPGAQLRRLPRRHRRAASARTSSSPRPTPTSIPTSRRATTTPRTSSTSSTGGRRRSTPCCCATAAKRSPTSSPTAGPAARCRRGASTVAARSTTSRSRTSSTTSRRSRSRPRRPRPTPQPSSSATERPSSTTAAASSAARARRCSTSACSRQLRRRRLLVRPLPHRGLVLPRRWSPPSVDGTIVVDRESFEATTANSGCGGALGPNLCDGDTVRQFPLDDDHVAFVTDGSETASATAAPARAAARCPASAPRPAEDPPYWINGGVAREPGRRHAHPGADRGHRRVRARAHLAPTDDEDDDR